MLQHHGASLSKQHNCVHVNGTQPWIANRVCDGLLASFLGLPTDQFLIACTMQKWRGKAWSISPREWCFVYVSRQRGEWSRLHFAHVLFILKQELYVFRFVNVQNSSAWGRNYKMRPQPHFFKNGPSLPPRLLHRGSNQKLESWKASEWG